MALPQGAVGLRVCAAAAALIEKEKWKKIVFSCRNKNTLIECKQIVNFQEKYLIFTLNGCIIYM